ncbi:hypothetical protein Poly51_40400 [Rubripirellula tenax]|uniref:Uncharacterized protein n=1 Tax=Rubripirellula tenax TaxID=2528015 RepID=A0A5C6ERP3_9BACT|nr:hypothetical protein [Rubripirellula tenax]TWU50747.1 hypothetical protein Poly51_40400 [Rubripirellula tenax]
MERDELILAHETGFVRSFIIRERRDRYLSQLQLPKKRGSFLDRLNHRFQRDLDDRCICDSPTMPPLDTVCYIIASEHELDGRFVPASDVSDILASAAFGIVVSFVPGKLVTYKDEAPSNAIWLQRP